jgi:hypothetical protein
MPVPPVGFTLQGQSPPAEPFVLSDVDTLLRLVERTSFRPDSSGFLESWDL